MANRRLIRQLAQSRRIGKACVAVGNEIRDRAVQIDPDADIRVTQAQLTVNGLRRVTARVEGGREIEWRHQTATGGPSGIFAPPEPVTLPVPTAPAPTGSGETGD